MAPVEVGTARTTALEFDATYFWTAGECAYVVGSALYVVSMDASFNIVVDKSSSLTSLSFSEQDSGNHPAAGGFVAFCSAFDGTYIHVICGESGDVGADLMRHLRFNTSTDAWTTDYGTFGDSARERNFRMGIRSDGDVIVAYTSDSDDADLRYARYEGSSWSADNALLSVSSGAASTVIDAVMDSSDRFHIIYHDVLNGDVSWRSLNSANSLSSEVDIETSGSGGESSHGMGAFDLYDDGGTDKVIAATKDSTGNLDDHILTLEADAASGGVGTVAQIAASSDVYARVGAATCVYDSTPYAAWSDGSSIFYSTKSGGSWAAKTTWKSSLTNAQVIQLLPISGTGLMCVYAAPYDTTGNTPATYVDWIVAPAADVTVNGSLATASGAANTGSLISTRTGSLATATGAALAGSVAISPRVTGSLAAADAAALAGSITHGAIAGSLSTATGAGLAGSLLVALTGSLSTATGTANAGTPTVTPNGTVVNGSLSTASAAANAGSLLELLTGSVAAADGAAYAGSLDIAPAASLATATAAGLTGTITHGGVTGNLSAATAAALAGSPIIAVTGALSTATAEALTGSLLIALTGSLATADAAALNGSASTPNIVVGSLATASAEALTGTVAHGGVTGSLATATAAALDGGVVVIITGSLSAATAEAYAGAVAIGPITVTGSLAEAVAAALAGKIYQRVPQVTRGWRPPPRPVAMGPRVLIDPAPSRPRKMRQGGPRVVRVE